MNSSSLLIVVMATFVGPTIVGLILSHFTNRSRLAEKKADWEREDKKEKEKADRAEQVAQSLLDSNKEIADTAAQSHKETNQKLEVIRVDVNSNMTAAMTAELVATEGQVALLREMVELKRTAGTEPTPKALAFIAAKDERINELKATLKDRLNHSEKIKQVPL
jgi:hypothetical protein